MSYASAVPPVLFDVAAVLALAVLLVVGFVHPPGWVEAAVGVAAAGIVTGLGSLSGSGPTRGQVTAELAHLFPVVAFLAAILVVAELCAAEGVFTAVGALVARMGRGRPRHMLTLTFLAAALTTATLSLDATVVLLTPVVAAAATGALVDARPMVFACVRLANTASLLLPVSNLTNLLALPSIDLSFLQFALVMAPVWLVVIGVEYVGHRLFFARELVAGPGDATPSHHGRLPLVPLLVVAVMLTGFAVASPLGVAPAWVATAAALALAVHALVQRRVTPRKIAHAAHLTFGAYILCLGIVVAGLSDSFLGDLVHAALPGGTSLPALLGIAVLATVLANVVNNLPATLLLVPLVAPLGATAVLAALIGLNVGAGLTYTGSLANLLWRRSLVRHGARPSSGDFHLLSALTTPPAVALAVVVLWAWSRLLRF